MTRKTPEQAQESLRPIASLISKSEKAQRRVMPGTWQYAMLRDHLQALRLAHELMTRGAGHSGHWTRDDLLAALQALASMIGRTEGVQTRFSPGTAQHTLLRNRLNALRIARTLIQTEADGRRGAR